MYLLVMEFHFHAVLCFSMGDEFFDADHTFTRAALTHVSQVPHPCLNN